MPFKQVTLDKSKIDEIQQIVIKNINSNTDISKLFNIKLFSVLCQKIAWLTNNEINRRKLQKIFITKNFICSLKDRMEQNNKLNLEIISSYPFVNDNDIISNSSSFRKDKDTNSFSSEDEIIKPAKLTTPSTKSIVLSEEEVFDVPKTITVISIKHQRIGKKNLRNVYTESIGILKISKENWNVNYDPITGNLNKNLCPSVVANLLTKQTGCVINIKSIDYSSKAISIRAYCSHTNCKQFKLKSTNLQQGIFEVYSTSVHTCHSILRTRQVRGSERKLLKQQLISVKFPEQVYETMIVDEDEAFVNKTNSTTVKSIDVLRKIRSEALKSEDNHTNDLIDLIEEVSKNDSSIQKFSIKPFSLMTYGETQIQIMKLLKNENGNNLVAYLDATGGLVRNPLKIQATIFYYALVVPIKVHENEPNDPFPLTDMVSSSHNLDAIGGWLRSYRIEIERQFKTWPIIKTVVTDFNFAQINAVLDSFNRMDIVQYLNVCHRSLEAKNLTNNLVDIRLCVSHLMHCMTADVNKNFAKSFKSNILKEIIASLYTIDDYSELKQVWLNISIILNSKHLNLSVCNAMDFLLKCATKPQEYEKFIKEQSTNEDEDTFSRQLNETLYLQSKFYQDFRHIMESTFTNDTLNKSIPLNSNYNPAFLQLFLKKYLTYLPFWSRVFNDHIYSNGNVENYFSVIKRRLGRAMTLGNLPAKPLRFLKEIRNRNTYIIKRKQLNIPKIFQKPEFSSIHTNSEDKTLSAVLDEQEMWRGQPKQYKSHFSLNSIKKLNELEETERKGSIINYLSAKTVKFATPKRSKNTNSLKVFKKLETDHLYFLRNSKMKTDHYYNTCAFDAFIQCILNINSLEFIDKHKHFSNLINALLNFKEDSAKVHRHAILAKLYGLNWDCTANITKISNHFLSEMNYCSIKAKSKCSLCQVSGIDRYNYLPIDLQQLDRLGVQFIQHCIKEPNKFYCCGAEKTINEIYSSSIIFVYCEKTIDAIETVSVSNIPSIINVYSEQFELTGFVNYIKASSHYIAYCFHNDRWEKYDDLLEHATNVKFPHTHNVCPHLLIYRKCNKI